jgi:hypothetical protein
MLQKTGMKGRGYICIGEYFGEEDGIYMKKSSHVTIGLELDATQPSLP